MKANVGSSILKDSFEAGVEIVRNSTKGLKIPKVGFLFTSTKYEQVEVLKGIKSVEPNLKVIGCTSSGAIMTPAGIISNDDGYAGMLVIEDNELIVGVASLPRGNDPRLTGRRVAKMAMDNAGKKHSPVAFAMFATPGEEEYYLKGIQDVLGEVPMFGGTASDDNIVGEWKVFSDEESHEDGVAIALIYTNKEIKTIFDGKYTETENMGIITKVDDGRTIVEIDNKPALKKYAEWIGQNADDLIGDKLWEISTLKPLAIKSLQGDVLAIRQPITGNEDYTFEVNTIVAEKTALIQMENDQDGLIGGAVEAIRELDEESNIGAMILVHSGFRKMNIDERIDEDFVAIKNAVGDLPFIVLFSFNEYGQMNHSGATIGALSLSFTGFSER